MINVNSLSRTSIGKTSSRNARAMGLIPSIVYSKKDKNKNILLSQSHFSKMIEHDPSLMTRVFEVNLFDKESEESVALFKTEIQTKPKEKIRCMIKEIKFSPTSNLIESIDLKEISEKDKVDVEVPVKFINREKSDVLKFGGFLHILCFNPKLRIDLSKTSVPEFIEYNLTGAKAGQIVRVSDFTLPKDVQIVYNWDVAKISAKKGS